MSGSAEPTLEPTFSVITASYDRPEMVRRAIASVRRQSFEDFELIVVDDGSRRDYRSLIDEARDPRVRVVRNPRNLGVGAARNRGMRLARGRYLSFLDDDDEYAPEFLERTYRRLEGSPAGVGLSWCSVRYLDDSRRASSGGRPPGEGRQPGPRQRRFEAHYPSRRQLYEQLMSIGTGFGVTLTAECAAAVGGFNEGLRTVEDTDLFFRVLLAGFEPLVIPQVGVVLHDHDQPRLTGLEMHPVRIAECRWLLNQYEQLFRDYPTLAGQLHLRIEELEGELDRHLREAIPAGWDRPSEAAAGQGAKGERSAGQGADGQGADGQGADGQRADGQRADGQGAAGQGAAASGGARLAPAAPRGDR